METFRPPARHSPLSQLLHWATAVLVLAAFMLGPGGSEAHVYSKGMDLQRRVHETLGLAVLAISVFRICWHSLRRRRPGSGAAHWMERASIIMQSLLYLLLLAVPISAVSGAWLEGHPLTWIGGDIAPWMPTWHDAGLTIVHVHGWLGDAILWLAGLHAAAALVHHYVLKDGVLLSMLPRKPTRRSSPPR